MLRLVENVDAQGRIVNIYWYQILFIMKQNINEIKRMQQLAGILKENIEESKTNKYIDLDEDGVEMLNKEAVTNYLKSVIDPEYIDDVDTFMSDDEGWEESSMYFFEVPEDPEATEQDVEEWAKQEISYYLFSKPDEFPHK